ncbi:MAG: prolyl oligopeptidase family serine peptidase, partial [Paludibacteraceae bacterium]|nr:prolyl oligopeptidase family serine peptidase [Paludibacteraceae bacterium]
LNYGYSQGGQTTVAAVKLSQSDEYRGRVHFTKSIAAAGPHDLQLTYRNFIENEMLGMPQALALTIIANNELLGLGLKYSDIFQKPLASHWKGWFLSKKFSSDEISDLIGTNEIASIMKPAYLDVNSEETQTLLNAVKIHDLTSGWTPDADTDILIMHSQNDDVVPYANSEKLYQFFVNAGVQNVQFDNTYLKNDHETSGTDFFLYLVTKFLPKW